MLQCKTILDVHLPHPFTIWAQQQFPIGKNAIEVKGEESDMVEFFQ
jgi:hypothetical protein